MRQVGDVECYVNFFSCTFVDFDTDEVRVFEISERINQLEDFVAFVLQIKYLIGFNLLHYDNVIIMYLVKNVESLLKEEWNVVTERLKSLSDCIINDSEGRNYRLYSKYKYPPYISIDLFMYWSKMTRISRNLSLKSFAINMNWHRIQELPIHHSAVIRLDQIDDMLSYNKNDTDVTKALAKKMSKDINLRVDAWKRYGFQCLSWDGVKLGLNILVKRYCDRVGKDMEEINKLRTPRAQIHIGEIMLPFINFKEGDKSVREFIEDKNLIRQFKSFYGLWMYLKDLVVTNTKSINCQVLYKGVRYDVKSGGLHTYHNPSIIVPGTDEIYEDDDVESYYPSFGEAWSIGPEHLGPEFPEELGSVKSERSHLKSIGEGKSNAAELLKLSMNGGFYGNTNNEYTPMFDPQAMLTITINGQLALLMLCEWLDEIGVTVDMCNTDGITIRYHKDLYDDVRALFKRWELMTRMKMESVKYVKVVRKDINNYLAFYDDKGTVKVKEKGMFLTNPGIDMSHDFVIIPKALRAYFEFGTPIEETIRNHKDIYDFCGSMKCDKAYQVWHGGMQQQHLNRYFIVKQGAFLYKSKDGKNMEHMMKGYPVQLFNNFYESDDYKIDYAYYISKTREVLNELEPLQSSLF